MFILQVVIGAFIGGMTNELAIRMLFRPYKAIYLGKWRLPFTPGLIPKRHEELARQMGKLVENFLITPEGIRKMLKKGKVEQEVEAWIQRKLGELASSDETVFTFGSRLGMFPSREGQQVVKGSIKVYIEQKIGQTAHLKLNEVLPERSRQMIMDKVPVLAPFLLERISQYVASDEGTRMIKQMLSNLAGGLGMFGGLAGVLLADEKIVAKVSGSLESSLKNDELKERLTAILARELEQLGEKQVDEVIHWLGEKNIEQLIDMIIEKMIDFDVIGQQKLQTVLTPLLPTIRKAVPQFVANLMAWVETNLEEGLQKLNLTQIASSQVEAFPVHRLEDMIVSITGKELKMITVLGALLGGVIGAVQAVIVLFAK
nr:DUF445 family protein [Ammoniphilus resinae]